MVRIRSFWSFFRDFDDTRQAFIPRQSQILEAAKSASGLTVEIINIRIPSSLAHRVSKLMVKSEVLPVLVSRKMTTSRMGRPYAGDIVAYEECLAIV